MNARPTLPADYSETSLARLFIAEHGANLRHVAEWKAWMAWDGTRWERNTLRADRLLSATVGRVEATLLSSIGDADDAEKKAALARDLMQLRAFKNHNKAVNTLARAATLEEVEAKPEHFDAPLHLLNVFNGTIDLVTGRLREHAREDMLTKRIDIEYDPWAEAPTWARFLDDTFARDQEMLDYIQAAIGYTLTGDTRETCLFFALGGGRNGKSTLQLAIQEILGDYAVSAPSNLLTSRNGAEAYEVAALHGARMVVVSELDDSRAMAEADVKRMTSQDKLHACRKYEAPFSFTPTHKLWLAANHLPTVRNSDDGIWRRMRILPFDVQVAADKVDYGLTAKLRKEYAGILAWAVRGCVRWGQEGLPTPTRVAEKTSEYRVDQDDLGRFISDCLVDTPGDSVSVQEVYNAYSHWCKDNGIAFAKSKRALSILLKERGFEGKKASTMQWANWRLAGGVFCGPINTAVKS